MEDTEMEMEMEMATLESSRSSSHFSFRSDESLDVGPRPPMSEYEEIASPQWLPPDFFVPRPQPGPSAGDGEARARSVFDVFQTHVADRICALLTSDEDGAGGELERNIRRRRPLISLSFLDKLLDAFLCTDEEFRALLPVLLVHRRAHVDRVVVSDLLDRSLRSLDVCRAVEQALDSLHYCRQYAEIAASALRTTPVRAAQFHRAKRALSNLLASLAPDQVHPGSPKEKGWAFGRISSGRGDGSPATPWYGRRTLSLDLSRNRWGWASVNLPRGAEATAAAMAVHTVGALTVFVTWTLLVAFPCREQGGNGPSVVAAAAPFRLLGQPWQVPWAAPMVTLQGRVAQEWRRERKGSSPGLMAELQSLVRCGRAVVELGGGAPAFPLEEGQQTEMAEVGGELAATCGAMEEGLGPLRVRVREVFRRVSRSREELLAALRQAGHNNRRGIFLLS